MEDTLGVAGTYHRWLEASPRLRRWLLLALVVAVPLLVAFGAPLRDPYNTPKVALLMAGVIVAGAMRGAELMLGASPRGLERLLLPALAFAVPLFIAWAASPNRGYSLSGADYGRYQGLIPYLLAVSLGVLVADAFGGATRKVVFALGGAGTAVAVYAIAQFLGFEIPGGPGGSFRFIAVSTLGNPNFTGGFIAICLSVLAPVALRDEAADRRWRWALFIMAIGLGRSFTQGAWIAAIGGVALGLGIALGKKWSWSRTAGIFVAGTMVLSLAGALVAGLMGLDLKVLSTVRSRGLTWETTLRAAADRPIFGHGLNTFGETQERFRSEEALQDQRRRGSVPDDPHSVPLAMLVNGGIITLVGWLLAVSWFFFRARAVRDGDVVGASFVGGVTAYLIQSLSTIDEISLRVSFWVCLGGLAALNEVPLVKRPQTVRGAQVRLLFAGLLLLSATIFSVAVAARFLVVHRV